VHTQEGPAAAPSLLQAPAGHRSSTAAGNTVAGAYSRIHKQEDECRQLDNGQQLLASNSAQPGPVSCKPSCAHANTAACSCNAQQLPAQHASPCSAAYLTCSSLLCTPTSPA
jgi:hypothetical protein